MALTYKEMFEDSAEMYPDAGFKMSAAACGFMLAEMEGLVEKYQKELADESLSPKLYGMIQRHLEGLEYITAGVRAGMSRKAKGN